MSRSRTRSRLLALAAVMAAGLSLREARRSGPPAWGPAGEADPGRLRSLSAGAAGPDRLEEARRSFDREGQGGWRDAVASPGRLSPSVFSALVRQKTSAGAGVFARAAAAAAGSSRAAPAAAREAAPRPAPLTREKEAARPGEAAEPPPEAGRAGGSAAAAAARRRAGRAARAQPRRARARARTEEEEAEAASGSEAAAARTRRRAKPAASEREGERPPPRPARQRRFTPIRLSKLWGRGSIRPPASAVKVPDLSFLDGLKPKALPGGGAVPPAAPPAAVEPLEPDAPACRRKEGHWHAAESLWHAGPAWGRATDSGWAWLARAEGRWWAWTSAKDPAWLRWRDRWWWRKDGFWFLLHDGEPWGYRAVSWGYDGFYHAPTGTEMAYSRDGRYVAVVVPGEHARVFDAYTGAYLGALDHAKLPPRKAPSAPSSLRPLW